MKKEKLELLKSGFELTLGAIVLGWVLLVNLGIMTRYVFKVAIPWNEELTVLLFNWVIFFGAALASLNDGHITITLLRDSLHGKVKTMVSIGQNVLFIVFILIVCVQSWKIVMLQARTEQFTAILNIPVYVTTLAMSIGSVLWLSFLSIKTYQLCKTLITKNEAQL
ncbi:TRAP transporter small permease [Sphaerochaeta sp. PS]|uniref:TRAP transporter small permease n=1 Tax=Sphaerochaeta sp. PS TaxID=3076336 RepID=UPI0028A4F03A|nr:TRAP transporter small permease [Sphaerochaeta sp. PS]MDT4762995.1 TRAP transporter small permease [Sphaerochaeta sp. PS]